MAARPVHERKLLKRVVLCGSVLLSLLAVEAVFRWRAHDLNRNSLGVAFSVLPKTSARGRTRFIDIVRPHANDRIIFDLKPDYVGEYYGRPYSTDSHGCRSPETPLRAGPGTVTIVGIGGSIMFGHGVGDGQDLLSVLGAKLNEVRPERRWRIVNTAVPTYNVVQKVETLKAKGLAFRPDLVVLEMASNNLDLPTYIRVEEDPLDVSRSFVVAYVKELLGSAAEEHKRLANVHTMGLKWRENVTPDPATVPAVFRDMVGWDPFYRALDELKQLRDEHGFEVLVVVGLEVDLLPQMMEEARRRGLPVVSAMQDFESFIQNRYGEPFTLDRYCASPLVVNTENLHPSVVAHEMIAGRAVRDLLRRGVVDRLVAKVPPASPAASR